MNQYQNVDENGITPSNLVKKMEVRENVVRSKNGVGMVASSKLAI
jgi:hypothetical protein